MPTLTQNADFTFFGLRRIRLNGIITSPCPEVSLDALGFPVGCVLQDVYILHKINTYLILMIG